MNTKKIEHQLQRIKKTKQVHKDITMGGARDGELTPREQNYSRTKDGQHPNFISEPT